MSHTLNSHNSTTYSVQFRTSQENKNTNRKVHNIGYLRYIVLRYKLLGFNRLRSNIDVILQPCTFRAQSSNDAFDCDRFLESCEYIRAITPCQVHIHAQITVIKHAFTYNIFSEHLPQVLFLFCNHVNMYLFV